MRQRPSPTARSAPPSQSTGDYSFGRVFGLDQLQRRSATAVGRAPAARRHHHHGPVRLDALPEPAGHLRQRRHRQPQLSGKPRNKSMNPESGLPEVRPLLGDDGGRRSRATPTYSHRRGAWCDPCQHLDEVELRARRSLEDFYQNADERARGSGNRGLHASARRLRHRRPAATTTSSTANNTRQPLRQDRHRDHRRRRDQGTGVRDERLRRLTAAHFNGYTEGPGYWGKTFFVWPPDPRGCDARRQRRRQPRRQRRQGLAAALLLQVQHRHQQRSAGSTTTTSSSTPAAPATTATRRRPTPIMRTPSIDAMPSPRTATASPTSYASTTRPSSHWLRTRPQARSPPSCGPGRITLLRRHPRSDRRHRPQQPLLDAPPADQPERALLEGLHRLRARPARPRRQHLHAQHRSQRQPLSSVPLSAMIGNGDFYTWGTVQISAEARPRHCQTGNINKTGGYAVGRGVSASTTSRTCDRPARRPASYVKFANHGDRSTRSPPCSTRRPASRLDPRPGLGPPPARQQRQRRQVLQHSPRVHGLRRQPAIARGTSSGSGR